jgi:hypothetical protein
MNYLFHTDDRSKAYCDRIVKAMELHYDSEPARACALLNKRWQGYDLRSKSSGGTSEFPELLYHETEREWAARLGNPCPYEEGPELDQWKARQIEAERRLNEYRKLGVHDWLYPW